MSFSEDISFKRENSLPTLIQREIERRIVSGELKPGDRLNENLLSASIGVSRGPVREACRKLEQAGLLTIVVNKGVFVRSTSDEEILEVREIRAALSQVAVRRVVANITDEELAEIERCITEMDEAIGAGDNQRYFYLNLKFHQLVLDASRMKRVPQMHAALGKELSLTRRQSLVTKEAMQASNNEHKVIANALFLRDDQAVSAAVASHTINSKARHLKAMELRRAEQAQSKPSRRKSGKTR